MSTHFDKLGEHQQQQQTTTTTKGTSTAPSITPITATATTTKPLSTGTRAGPDSIGTRAGPDSMGPLQAQALARHHANTGDPPVVSRRYMYPMTPLEKPLAAYSLPKQPITSITN